MRVISKFVDYYDKVVAYGHDDTVVYLREQEVLYGQAVGREVASQQKIYDDHLKFFSQLYLHYRKLSNGREVHFNPITVLFCGKLYGGVRITIKEWGGVEESSVVWGEEQFFLKCAQIGLDASEFEDKKPWHPWRCWRRPDTPFGRKLSEHLQLNGDPKFLDYAIENKIVCMSFEEPGERSGYCTIIKNPRLTDIQFFKAVEHFTAFQEIDMFLSGVMAPENRPMVQIEDKYKIKEHGFDEWSFKKLPGKKR